MYSYYPAEHGRSSSDRSTVLPPPHTIPVGQQSHDDEGSRRYAHQHASSAGYPHNPSPATQAPTKGMALPPFNSFYQSSTYHSPQQQHAPGSAPAGLHPLPPHAMYAHGQHAQHAQHPSYGYPMASPASMQPGLPGSRQPGPYSHSESPRIMGQYTSPNGRTTSPGSPHNWLMPPPPMAQSAGSNSSSSYPSATRTPAGLPKQDLPRSKKRSGSAAQSTGSWEDDDKMGPLDDDDQPWGMPQEQYKALNPRDKKQVRNRIGARRFRAKRKGMSVFSNHAILNCRGID